MLAALVEGRLGEYPKHGDQPRYGVVRKVGIGGVSLNTFDAQSTDHRPPPPDLDHVADVLGIGGLAHEADVDGLAVLSHPLEHLPGAVDGGTFLIPGYQHADRTLPVARTAPQKPGHRGDEAGDRAFHVGGPATIQDAATDFAGERIGLPLARVADRNDIRVPGKAKGWGAVAEPGVKVVDLGCAGLGKRQTPAPESQAFQFLLQDIQGSLVRRRHARTSDHAGRELRRVNVEGEGHESALPGRRTAISRAGVR